MKKELSAGGVVFKYQGHSPQVLLVKHARSNYWGFPKGLVADQNNNESLSQAAIREVQEEGGVKAKIIKKIPDPICYFYDWQGEKVDKTVWYYVMKYISGDPKKHDKEVSDARFFSIQQAQKTLTYHNDQRLLLLARKLLEE